MRQYPTDILATSQLINIQVNEQTTTVKFQKIAGKSLKLYKKRFKRKLDKVATLYQRG